MSIVIKVNILPPLNRESTVIMKDSHYEVFSILNNIMRLYSTVISKLNLYIKPNM